MKKTLKDIHNQPILVYGSRKAGTTLLQSLIDSEEIFVLPGEVKLNRVLKHLLSENKKTDYFRHMQSSSQKLIAINNGIATQNDQYHVHGLSHTQTREVFSIAKYVQNLNSSEDHENLKQLIELDVESHIISLNKPNTSFKKWAIKDVGLHPHTTMSVFKNMYPKGKIICIIRDPLYVTRSIIRNWKKRNNRRRFYQVPFYYIEAAYINSVCRRFSKSEDVYIIEYEKLVSQPIDEMRKLSDFLNMSYTELLTTPTTLGMEAKVATASENNKAIFSTKDKWYHKISFLERSAIYIAHFGYKLLKNVMR